MWIYSLRGKSRRLPAEISASVWKSRGRWRRKASMWRCARATQRVYSRRRKRIETEFGVKAIGVKADVTVPAEIDGFVEAIEASFGGADILINNAGARHERNDHGCAGRAMAVLLGTACHGGDSAGARAGAVDEAARRRRDFQQRLDLRDAADVQRADLQHDQSGAGDDVEVPRARTDPVQYSRECGQSGLDRDAGLDDADWQVG